MPEGKRNRVPHKHDQTSIVEIEVNGHRVRCNHSEDYLRLRFYEGSYAFMEPYGPPGTRTPVQSGVVILLEAEEVLDMINMLQDHYDKMEKKFEFGYGLDVD